MSDSNVAMEIIVGAGDSTAYSIEAIEHAREGRINDAWESLKNAASAMVDSHRIQTQVIRNEMEGKGEGLSVLMVHAQDHLSTASIMRDFAEEFINLYERIKRLEGGTMNTVSGEPKLEKKGGEKDA
jgi:PTS system cellobiose-specific IIA component